jgi:hypothetical protein
MGKRFILQVTERVAMGVLTFIALIWLVQANGENL